MKIEIDGYTFTSTHETKRGVITLEARIGSMGTTLIKFWGRPQIPFDDFDVEKELFKKVLAEFFKQPKEFIEHWSVYRTKEVVNNWIQNTKLWGMEFRMIEHEMSGPWILHYMNDDNSELKLLSEEFKNYFK